MPYRSVAHSAPRVLVVRNNSSIAALATTGTGLCFLLVGLACLPMTGVVILPGAEVVTSAMGTVFVLVGITIASLGVRMRRSQTVFALDGGELNVSVSTGGSDPDRLHSLPVDDIEHVVVDDDSRSRTYRAQILVRGRAAIDLGEDRSASRRHHDHLASNLRAFLAVR